MDFLRSKIDRSATNNPVRPARSPTGRRPTPSPPSRITSPTKVSIGSSSAGPSSVQSTPVKKWRWFSSHFFKSSLSKRSRKYQNLYDNNNVILTKFIPISGCVSYTAFAFHVYQPRGLFSYLATQDVPIIANCLLFNAHIGIGLYLYSRLHISSHSSNLCITKQIIYSIYGAVLFNFGSILLWATTSSIIPTESVLARTFIAISSSVALLLIGHEYMSYIDYRCRDRDKSSVDASDEEEDADDESDIHYHNFS